ncbi:MAG TPA: hypothetical protein VE224_00875, partial [Pseudolabrys sp.]|nr:hypothetical protein [Pseudolabrys sp.]
TVLANALFTRGYLDRAEIDHLLDGVTLAAPEAEGVGPTPTASRAVRDGQSENPENGAGENVDDGSPHRTQPLPRRKNKVEPRKPPA